MAAYARDRGAPATSAAAGPLTVGSGIVADLRRKISGLRRAKRFVRYGESSELARDLQEIVDTIESEVKAPVESLRCRTTTSRPTGGS